MVFTIASMVPSWPTPKKKDTSSGSDNIPSGNTFFLIFFLFFFIYPPNKNPTNHKSNPPNCDTYYQIWNIDACGDNLFFFPSGLSSCASPLFSFFFSSLWSDLNHAKNIGKYLNPLYHHSNIVNVLNPSVSPNKIVFWSNLYDRCESTLTPPPSMVIASRVTQLLDERRVDQEVQKIQESHAKLLSKLQKQQILAEILSERLGVNLDDDDLIREVKERLHVRKSQTKQVRIPTTTVTTAAATTTTTTTTTTTNTATPHPPAPPANPPAAPTPAAAATTGTSANTTQNYKEFYNFQGQKKKNVVVQ
eukprot:TRINITY_DN4864_c0_g2_i1.p1 TRINITY_DN4864_c0_g2~~TRINITY_DN4864_c0_g2_i1.p1  ORF type:complete len:305 (-),score=77.67 TRINITY_DN4864_c0_g2_i1:36-950(-)